MKRLLVTTSLILAGAGAALPAAAQQADIYVNGAYTYLDSDSTELGGLTGRLGVNFGSYLGAEGEATVGIQDDGNVELDNEFGIYGVGRLPVNPQFDLFARVGYSSIETSPGGDADGVAYGVGGNFYFTDKDGIRADYTRHDPDDASEVDAWSVGYVRKF